MEAFPVEEQQIQQCRQSSAFEGTSAWKITREKLDLEER